MSGHGGYDDGPATYYYPSFYHEMGRARDLNKPVWYLPTWYGENSDDLRLEQYLSFMMNLQGMATPPDFAPSEAAINDLHHRNRRIQQADGAAGDDLHDDARNPPAGRDALFPFAGPVSAGAATCRTPKM